MSLKEILFNIIIPLISGFIGGKISTVILVQKNAKKNTMKNKDINIDNGDIINGNKC